MRKLLLLLSILLSFSTLHAQMIEQELDSIQESMERVRLLLNEQPEPDTNIGASVADIRAEMISKNIIEIVFNTNTIKPLDDIYYAPALHSEWPHSYAKYQEPINPEEESVLIGVGVQADWRLKVLPGEWESDIIDASKWNENQVYEKPLIGIWDSWNAPDTFDLWKDYSNRIDTSKENLISQVGNFKNGMNDTEIRLRIERRLVDGDVLFYLLDDEPFLGSGKLSGEYWNHINDIAAEFDIPFGWSLSDNKVQNYNFYSEHEMIIPINTYLFFRRDYGGKDLWGNIPIHTKEDFFAEADRVFNDARRKLPYSKFIFVGQAFYTNAKYRKPPLESVAWTYEYVASHPDIIGVLWYEWEGRDGAGLKDMPDLYEAIKK